VTPLLVAFGPPLLCLIAVLGVLAALTALCEREWGVALTAVAVSLAIGIPAAVTTYVVWVAPVIPNDR